MSLLSSSLAELETIRHKTAMMDGQEGQADKAGATHHFPPHTLVFYPPPVSESGLTL